MADRSAASASTATAASRTTRTGKVASATPGEATAAVGLSEADRRELLAAMARSIEPVRSTPLYSAGLILVAVAMLLLPLIYLALVGGVAYATWWHATENASIFEGRGNAKGKFIAYIAPLIVGLLFVLFMVKPLFARRSQTGKPLSLDPHAEPLLFGFVERLCGIIGAPKPVRIDIDCQVNASASFKSNGPFGWMSRSLVLTIGLPLAAGLTVRELAGVLAHEFGHFAQGTGMRVTYIIRSVNGWFYRVVNERDSWDDGLKSVVGEFGLIGVIIVAISSLLIWLTRRILWCLMMLGHAISSFMSRQMEFDADQYEARVAGSMAFQSTSRKLRLLNITQGAVLDELQGHWRDRRICNDIPALIARRVDDIPPKALAEIDQMVAAQKTAWHDSHPCDGDRIAAVRQMPADGIIALEAPAGSLFADFPALCNRVTGEFYTNALGELSDDVEVVTADEVVGKRKEQKEKFVALERYFQGLVHGVRPVFFDTSTVLPATRDEAAEQVLLARSELTEQLPQAREAAKAWEACLEKLVGFTRAWALQEVGHRRLDHASFGLSPVEVTRLSDVYKEQTHRAQEARQVLDPLLWRQMYRLQCALEIERMDQPVPPPPPPVSEADDYGSYDLQEQPAPNFGDTVLVVTAFDALRQVSPTIDELRIDLLRLGELFGQLKPDNNDQRLIDNILQTGRLARQRLQDVRNNLQAAWYPYEHGEHGVTLAKYLIPAIPEADAVGDVAQATDSALDGFYSLYGRLLSDLASRAEAIESSLGLPPGEAPENPDE